MTLTFEVEGSRFRVQTQAFSTQWVPDTPVNRQVAVVWLRLLVDGQGKRLFTLQELAAIVGSENRQAASQHVEDFRACGEEFRALVLRKRKVDAGVVEGVSNELIKTPLAGGTELAERVNERLGRSDLTAANMLAAAGADSLCARAAGAATADRSGTGALSRGLFVRRDDGKSIEPRWRGGWTGDPGSGSRHVHQ